MFSLLETGNADTTTAVTTTTTSNSSSIGDGTQVVFTTELMPTECLVRLQSKAPADSKKRPLFAVHAIEGFVTALKPLAAKLSVPVWGLQCTADAPLTSIIDLAAFYVKHIKQVQPTGPYTIAGYSFGGCVAFEMVSWLEKSGDKATLVMLDGSPKYVSWYTEAHQSRVDGGSTDAQNEAYALSYFGMVCSNIDYAKTTRELEPLPSFEARLKRVAELISAQTKYQLDIVSVDLDMFLSRESVGISFFFLQNVIKIYFFFCRLN